MIEATLVNILSSDSGLGALVGSRIRPFTDTNLVDLPCLTYWRLNTQRPYCNDGPIGQCMVTFQLDSWAPDASANFAILDAVRLAMDGISGTFNGTTIDYIHVIDQQDQISTTVLPGSQKPVQRSTMQITISYQEAGSV